MELQKLFSLTRQAIDKYQLIDDGDKIAVGISGGKDSLTLLYALNGLRRFYPKRFDIEAITVDIGFGMDFSPIISMCSDMGINYTIKHTDIKKIVFDDRKEANPCSLCAKMRKGALNNTIKELGCNKVAYAHHKDDVITTMLLSLLYEGRFHSFMPSTYLDKTELTVIRPLIFVNEADVLGFVNKYNLPVVKSTCPADGFTKRQYAEDLLDQLIKENPGVKERLFAAITSGLYS